MKKLVFLFITFISSISFSQGYDFQQLCLDCVEQNGFFCGDDPSNWTQYSPNGCVPNGAGGLFYLNDGWEDCADGSDEQDAVPTSPEDCGPPPPDCDTIFVDIPIIEYIYEIDTIEVPFFIYETEFIFDTIVETEYITQIVIDTFEVETFVPEYIYVTDTVTVYAEVLDTMFIDVIEYVDVIVIDTVVETQYVEIVVIDTVVEYIEIVNTEYVDCETGMPCNSGIEEVLDKSKGSGLLYNLQGQAIRKPEDIYIENGKIKYLIK